MLKFLCAIMIVTSVCFNHLLLGDIPITKKKEVIYFGAVWCEPCKQMKKIFKDPEVQKELLKFDFKMVDIDKQPELKKRYNIRVVPTTVTKDGKKIKKYEGGMTKASFLRLLSKLSS